MKSLIIFCVGVLNLFHLLGTAQPLTGASVYSENFDNLPSQQLWRNLKLLVVQDAAPPGNKVVRAAYPIQGSASQVMVFNHLIDPEMEYTLSYDILLEKGWNPVEGGKFFGLGPENHTTGCKDKTDEGWSSRIVIRDRKPHIYYYDQRRSDTVCGNRKTEATEAMVPGRWYALSLYVRVNSSASQADGITSAYMDGKRVAHQTGIQFRKSDLPRSMVTKFLAHTFLGGGPNGPVTETFYAQFDNFHIQQGLHPKINPGAPVLSLFDRAGRNPIPQSGLVRREFHSGIFRLHIPEMGQFNLLGKPLKEKGFAPVPGK